MPASHQKNGRILVVDDDETYCLVISKMLQKKGYEVLNESRPLNVLSLINSFQPDLVLLDIMMPDIDGLTLLLEIRKTYSQIQLPVLMLSGKNSETDVVRGLSNGANDYITKPINFPIALARISTQLSLKFEGEKNSRIMQLEAIRGMVVTYNHEINNPLAIALGTIDLIKTDDRVKIEKLAISLTRIADIVKKITEVSRGDDIDFANYSENTKMIKL